MKAVYCSEWRRCARAGLNATCMHEVTDRQRAGKIALAGMHVDEHVEHPQLLLTTRSMVAL